MAGELIIGDCLEVMRSMPDKSVDLVFTSPPYEDARLYDMEFKLSGQKWAEWAFYRYLECLRVSRGLVAWVVEGRTEDFRYSGTPIMLAAMLLYAHVPLRKPPVYYRKGIPGSGGPDWWRNDWEWIICATDKQGRLPWSDNKAMGHPPKYKPGGEMSHRTRSGRRCNIVHTKRMKDGTMKEQGYRAPDIANPGNVIHCTVGGGRIGDAMAHKNEAPFPEDLAKRFILSFCPPGGTVLDPFCGGGTTCKVASLNNRNYIGIDIRQSQVELSDCRIRTFGKGAGSESETCSVRERADDRATGVQLPGLPCGCEDAAGAGL